MANPTGKGGFRPGNPGGPGRPRREVERAYQKATAGSVTPAGWKAIVKRAVEDAKAGDHLARAWLTKVLIGDEPAVLAEVVEELRAVLERLRHGHAAEGSPALAGGGAGANWDGTAAGAAGGPVP